MKNFLDKLCNADIRAVLSLITILCSFGLLFTLALKPMPKENETVLQVAIGFVLGGTIGAVFGYYFASSKKAKKEDDLESK